MYIGNISEVKDLGEAQGTSLSLEDFLSLLCKYPNSFYYGVLWNKLFRRELIAGQRVRFNSQLEWGEDFDFITRYLVGARRSFLYPAAGVQLCAQSQRADAANHPVCAAPSLHSIS